MERSLRREFEKQVKRLDSPLVRQRALAIRALGDLGAIEAVDVLLELAGTYCEDELLRSLAYAFGRLDACQALFERLQEAEGTVVLYFLSVLEYIGFEEPQTGFLMSMLLAPETNGRSRDTLVRILGNQSGSSEKVLEAWRDGAHRDKAVRQALVTLMGSHGSPEGLKTLIEIVGNMEESIWLRSEAARFLGERKVVEAREVLCRALEENDYHGRVSFARALGAIGGGEVVEPLIAACLPLYGSDKKQLIDLLMEIAPDAGIPLAGEVLRSHDDEWTTLCDYAKVLGLSRKPEALAYLHEELLEIDPDEDFDQNYWFLRASIAETLGKIGDVSSLPFLEKAIWQKEEHDDYSVKNAVEALANFPVAQATPILLRVFSDKHPNSSVLWKATEVLNQLGVSEPLCAMLKDRDAVIRKQAAEALRFHDVSIAGPVLLDVLEDSDVSVLNAALESLAQLKPEGLEEALLRLIKKPVPDGFYHYRVFRSLGELAATGAIPVLLEFLAQDPPPAFSTLVEALAALGAKEAIPRLLECFQTPEGRFPEMVDALVSLEVAEAAPIFLKILRELPKKEKEEALNYNEEGMFIGIARAARWMDLKEAEEVFAHFVHSGWKLGGPALEALCGLKSPLLLPILKEELSQTSNTFNTDVFMRCFEELEQPEVLALLLEMLRGERLPVSSAHYRRKDAARSCGVKIQEPGVVDALFEILRDEEEDRELRWMCAKSLTHDSAACVERLVQARLLEAFEWTSVYFHSDLGEVLAGLRRAVEPILGQILALQEQAQQGADGVEALDTLEELFVSVHEIYELFDKKRKEIDDYKDNQRPDWVACRADLVETKRRWAMLVDALRHNVLLRLQDDWEEVLFG